MGKRVRPESAGIWYRIIVGFLRPILVVFTKRDWRGGKQLQEVHGVVVAMNHLSWFDPFASGHFVHNHGRQVRFLAKAEVFKLPGIGTQ